MPFHLLANFKKQKYYENEPKINGVYPRNNLSDIWNGAYIISSNSLDCFACRC